MNPVGVLEDFSKITAVSLYAAKRQLWMNAHGFYTENGIVVHYQQEIAPLIHDPLFFIIEMN